MITSRGCFLTRPVFSRLSRGDIVLLKGEGWYGNDGLGAVHCSPAISGAEKRLVVTFDFA
ncbi:DUF1826 domain-containing protein [Amphritea sp. 1_MG-2023]|uniref:DUF1826 domain-containing protein n=1 Tax=Amphritea sp. 1_MG-2023 TaxID=3062670 RepID=UPI0026E28075|nr:DUF1826 domain-containing protein [Amphritea sp. 1_MG-2023]MDO6563422.1 DUF1826 domain-containing protein [Amphritea sp. 1_MG-2023]